jgi:hypothetical protein
MLTRLRTSLLKIKTRAIDLARVNGWLIGLPLIKPIQSDGVGVCRNSGADGEINREAVFGTQCRIWNADGGLIATDIAIFSHVLHLRVRSIIICRCMESIGRRPAPALGNCFRVVDEPGIRTGAAILIPAAYHRRAINRNRTATAQIVCGINIQRSRPRGHDFRAFDDVRRIIAHVVGADVLENQRAVGLSCERDAVARPLITIRPVGGLDGKGRGGADRDRVIYRLAGDGWVLYLVHFVCSRSRDDDG